MSLLACSKRTALRTISRTRPYSLVVDAPSSEWVAKREAIKHHASGTTALWRRISFFVCVPTTFAVIAWVRNVEAEHAEHQEHIKKENDGHLPEVPAYEYMNKRVKGFPWGPNSLFFNPHVNKDMSDQKSKLLVLYINHVADNKVFLFRPVPLGVTQLVSPYPYATMPPAIISPSVLASDFGQLTAECKRMIKGGAQWLHMDVMDGHFVPNISMGAPVIASVSKGVPGIFMDCHMMVSQPEKWVNDIADAGGSLYCFHIEAASDPVSLIHGIHERRMKAGVAISPDTPSTSISDEVGELADLLLVMTVYPGRGGQKFMERCVPKVAELRARFPDKDIEVDGGVNPKTIDACAQAGSNVIVAGTAIFGSDKPEEVIATLKSTVDTVQGKIHE